MTKKPDTFDIKKIFNPVTLATSLILLVGLVVIVLIIIFLGRNPVTASSATPEITMIAAPTLTPTMADPTATPTPTPTSIFFLPKGVVGVGAYVQVSGTGGAGLRMRGQPGLAGSINFSALDSEVFLVIDGPVDADGYTWWHLEAPYDPSRNGWSAGEFLTPIEEEVD